MKSLIKFLIQSLFFFCVVQNSSHAHVVFAENIATAGSYFKGTLRVGHGCGEESTTAITVQIPEGFQGSKPQPKFGWKVTTKKVALPKPYLSHGKTVTEDVIEIKWEATSPDYYLANEQFDEFSFFTHLPDEAGNYWVKVLQQCVRGENFWSEIPSNGTSTKGIKTPAALLTLAQENVAKVPVLSTKILSISDAWTRPTLSGQKSAAVFMKILASEHLKLVQVSSKLAKHAQIHQMSLSDNIMKMSPIEELDLPAKKLIELNPQGLHIMLMDLSSEIPVGGSVPLRLFLKDDYGNKRSVNVEVPVSNSPTDGGINQEHHH